jgi:hypothetical protein
MAKSRKRASKPLQTAATSRGSSSLIHRFSGDLIQSIIVYSVQEASSKWPFDISFERRNALYGVCRRWHDISMAIQDLWTSLSFTDGPGFELRTLPHISRSRARPLSIRIDLANVKVVDFGERASSVIRPVVPRIQYLGLSGEEVNIIKILSAFQSVDGDTCRLSHFDLTVDTSCEEIKDFEDHLGSFLNVVSKPLERVRLIDTVVNWSLFPFRDIVVLQLRILPGDSELEFRKFQDIIRTSPRLEELDLLGLVFVDDWDSLMDLDDMHIDDVDSKSRKGKQPVVLTSLKILRFKLVDHKITRWFFSDVRAPCLEILGIDDGILREHQSLLVFLLSSRKWLDESLRGPTPGKRGVDSIEELIIDDGMKDVFPGRGDIPQFGSQKFMILQALSTLKRLRLDGGCFPSFVMSGMGLPPKVNNELLCPHLTELHLSELVDLNPKDLVDMIYARERLKNVDELKVLSVKKCRPPQSATRPTKELKKAEDRVRELVDEVEWDWDLS